jgi:hypothetical protein
MGLLGMLLATPPSVSQAGSKEEVQKFCTGLGSWAETMMKARQSGVSLSEVLTITGNDSARRQDVMSAYEYPRYASSEMQRRASQDFRNDIELKCFQTYGS